jgi:hypothetical protein
MAARADYLITVGLARRKGQQMLFAQGLHDTLKPHEIEDAVRWIVARIGHVHKPSITGSYGTGVFRERVTLASGRFAMIDDGVCRQLLP